MVDLINREGEEKRVLSEGFAQDISSVEWSIGKTDWFKASVVAKPVINWYSFVLTADGLPFFSKYWFKDKPWDVPEDYLKFLQFHW